MAELDVARHAIARGSISRRHLAVAALAALVAWAIPGVSRAQKPPEQFQTAAPHAILIEADSGSVLFEKAADLMTYPASLAKLMTAEVVFNEIKQGRLDPETEFMVSENAWRRGGAPSGGSTMFAPLNSRIRVIDLLHGVIIQSGNDAC